MSVNTLESMLDDQTARLPRVAPRRLRGLRMPVLPTGAWLSQVGGGITALVGSYLQFGVAVTLIIGGVAAVVVGALREAGKV
jgi:hypothetical protein